MRKYMLGDSSDPQVSYAGCGIIRVAYNRRLYSSRMPNVELCGERDSIRWLRQR